MKKQIEVSFGYTVNVGNYESAKISMGITRDLLEDEDFDKALSNEFAFVQEKVVQEVETLLEDLKTDEG
ncbi:hypothetical protein DRH13_06090 [Candidatus Woesebacteria bacterium]|nr:MAG: hypothetical protein DRH13_06090 [Candidatus Woesebacteria bacterium]